MVSIGPTDTKGYPNRKIGHSDSTALKLMEKLLAYPLSEVDLALSSPTSSPHLPRFYIHPEEPPSGTLVI